MEVWDVDGLLQGLSLLSSDYRPHVGWNKDDAVPSSGGGWKRSPTFLFPGVPKRSGDVTGLFADILFAAGCTEGLLFFSVLSLHHHPNIYMRNHNCTAWGGKTSKASGCRIAAFIGLCNHPRSFLVPLRLWLCLCAWQDGLFEPSRAFAA